MEEIWSMWSMGRTDASSPPRRNEGHRPFAQIYRKQGRWAGFSEGGGEADSQCLCVCNAQEGYPGPGPVEAGEIGLYRPTLVIAQQKLQLRDMIYSLQNDSNVINQRQRRCGRVREDLSVQIHAGRPTHELGVVPWGSDEIFLQADEAEHRKQWALRQLGGEVLVGPDQTPDGHRDPPGGSPDAVVGDERPGVRWLQHLGLTAQGRVNGNQRVVAERHFVTSANASHTTIKEARDKLKQLWQTRLDTGFQLSPGSPELPHSPGGYLVARRRAQASRTQRSPSVACASTPPLTLRPATPFPFSLGPAPSPPFSFRFTPALVLPHGHVIATPIPVAASPPGDTALVLFPVVIRRRGIVSLVLPPAGLRTTRPVSSTRPGWALAQHGTLQPVSSICFGFSPFRLPAEQDIAAMAFSPTSFILPPIELAV
ncbi:hypothetical protein PPTG_22167 [Phytophthora nicotianae INRA-310]|uniref:Uncharacterized protein n=1 Tax=Phytophthora nicotianae (strain INRA-310) TaxID=761204 RepID=W2QNT4_PHYN3|nr:hypothetical protein PPTG_22167 [Phytophthora nicotianae INRA-310]ETN14636.1 hypothetical protein PPTG_22167 [Phytophthora nicotianae INRA-310]